jgi:hypothetical protein
VSKPRLASLQLQAGLLEAEISISSVEQILQRLQQAATSLRDFQKRHRELRATYLEGLAEAIVPDRSPDLEYSSMVQVQDDRVTNQIKQLLKRENMRRMFRKLKRIIKPVVRMGLSKVDVPDPTARPLKMEILQTLRLGRARGSQLRSLMTLLRESKISIVPNTIKLMVHPLALDQSQGPSAAEGIQLRLMNSFKVQSHLTSRIYLCYRKLGVSSTLWQPPIPLSLILMVESLRMTSFLLTPLLKSPPPLLPLVGI